MASGRQIATILIALTVAGVLLSPFVSAVNDNTGSVDVTNETITADTDNFVELEGYNIDKDSETVYIENQSSGGFDVGTKDSDYDIRDDEGSINMSTGGTADVDDGDTVKVSYTYQATSDTTTTVVTLGPLFMALLILGVMASKLMGMM